MRISHLTIENLRAVARLDLSFADVTTLIGENNAGKSTALKAIQIFFDTAPKLSDDDYHNRVAEEIKVTLSFDRFTPAELEEFKSAIIDGSMTITRTFSKKDAANHLQYSVSAEIFAGFSEIRAEGNRTKQRSLYNIWAKENNIPIAANSEEVEVGMRQWESENPASLTRSSIRGFFGVPNVACGKLRKKTSVHYVPAVADVVEETSDTRKSPIIALLTEIAKQVFENRQEVKEFVERTTGEFTEITNPDNFPQLSRISENLTATIQKYYRESRLLADWQQNEGIRVAYPQPAIKIEDGGFISGLQNVGHGLQRAALFSVIEFLSGGAHDNNQEEIFDAAQSDIILLIEEPEIYQHPIKQQVIYEAFHKLCDGFSVATGIRFQIIFTTHSEKFIGLNKFNSARILRKYREGDDIRHTTASIEISACSRYFANLAGREPLPDTAFEAKMHIFSRELCEGFFANKVILVEGVSDKAAIEGAYRAAQRSPEAEGIAILAADGKTKMDKPLYIFRKLGIPVYPVFDSDQGKSQKKQKPQTNVLIQRILGIDEPSEFPDGCLPSFCSYGINMESYLSSLHPELWQERVEFHRNEFGLDTDDICKTPRIIAEICGYLREQGVVLERLDGIIAAVDAL